MTKNYICLLFILFFQLSFAQIGFEATEVSDFTKNIEKIVDIDIDNDGDMDIVAISLRNIDLYENIGGIYNFKRKRNLASYDIYYENTHIFYDFDQDGDLDLVYIDPSTDQIIWKENDGLGNFGTVQVIVSNVEDAIHLKVSDMDGDGDGDFVYAIRLNSYDLSMVWLENNGTSVNNYTVSHAMFDSLIAEPLLVDFDNDGDIDVLMGRINQAVWFPNNGDGTFGVETIYSLTYLISQFSVVDMDNDNDLDFVYIKRLSTNESEIVYFENEGDNTFVTEHPIAEGYLNIQSLDVKDLDNDGKLDVIYANRDASLYSITELVWKKNIDEAGNFGDPITINANISYLRDIITSDIDNDGDEDIVVSNASDLILSHENISTSGTFAEKKVISESVNNANNLVSGDIDNDGDVDVIATRSSDTGIILYRAESENGVDYFSPQLYINETLANLNFLHLADIDGDTDLDIIVISGGLENTTIHEISWLENTDGQGNFSEPISITNTDLDSAIATLVYDMDGDMDLDIVCNIRYSSFNNQIVWFENTNGQGDFSALQTISTSNVGLITYLTAADLNHDGNVDILAIANIIDGEVSWFESDGQGGYGQQQIIASNIRNPDKVVAADLDGDSYIDVAYMDNGFPKTIVWQKNTDGAGNFGEAQNISIEIGGNGTEVIAANDIDNDGDIDIIASSFISTLEGVKTVWIENSDGLGNFGPLQTIGTNLNYISDLQVTDIDSNGMLDVIITDRNDNKIILYKNEGVVFNQISGTVQLDMESDGCDASDSTISNMLINITDGTNSYSTFTLNDPFDGYYQYFVEEGSYTVSVDSPNYYVSSPLTHTANFTGVDNIETADFCIQPIGTVNDLNVAVYPYTDDPRPGFSTRYQIVYKNVGTTQLSGNVTFEFDDSKLQFLNANEAVSSQTSTALTFDYTDLDPFETRTINLLFNVFAPPTTNIDDILVSTVTINPIGGDETPEDNIFELQQIVIGSYDPNDIRVLEGTEITIDEIDKYLHYIIRFQNTGTASAINVKIDHVLDNKLDWATIQLESLSHSGRVEIIDGNNVSFIFDNINLPDSTNDEPNSHGYVAFKIKPKSTVVIGDILSGTADIFFDFNPPITTNTATTEIVAPLSVVEFDENRLSIYPNPTKDIVTIKANKEIESISIYDLNGRLLKTMTHTNSSRETSISMKDLSMGVYFMKIKTDSGTQMKKVIKQ